MLYFVVFILSIALIVWLVKLAIKAFKYSFDDSHSWILRILAFAVACWIAFSLFGGE